VFALSRWIVCAPFVLATSVAAQASRGPLDLDSAAAILGTPPVLIPGAAVVEVRRPARYAPQVVILQELASGDTVALTERPARESNGGWSIPPANPPATAVSELEAGRAVPAPPISADRLAQINYENSRSGTVAAPGPISIGPFPQIAPPGPLTRFVGRLRVTIAGRMARKALQATLNSATPRN